MNEQTHIAELAGQAFHFHDDGSADGALAAGPHHDR